MEFSACDIGSPNVAVRPLISGVHRTGIELRNHVHGWQALLIYNSREKHAKKTTLINVTRQTLVRKTNSKICLTYISERSMHGQTQGQHTN
uniref:Uncharacterized protein n=1 Tax=Trichobilharzia regenti TaxID=157069 RepID=A0AA85KDN9_TRIRE|nr:unnamed protein product [Trichobilharzia regenti]